MNATRLEKIRAIANDKRGDPATRAVAQSILNRYAKSEQKPARAARADPRVHGLRLDPAYEFYTYIDLSQWDKTKAGNLTTMLYRNGVSYRIVLFRYKRSDTYGWMRVDINNDDTVFSDRFDTINEAQVDAWRSLTTN